MTDNDPSCSWLTTRRFAALLAVLVFAAFPQIILGLQTFVYRDFGYYAYPLAHYFRESFWRGEVPLWNPLSYCGLPFLAQWNTQVLYPPALVYLILPLSWSLGVFCVLHLFIAGLGMFVLARRTGNHFAAAFAAVAYAFSGLLLNSTMWPGTIPGFAWMPWMLWLTERAWREGGRFVILTAFVGALQMLSGAVEVILMTWLLAGALALCDFIRNKAPRVKMIVRFASVVLLIAGICAAQLLPFFQLLDNSDRQGAFARDMWPMPLGGWGNFFVPLFRAAHAPRGMFLQYNQFWTSSYYVGALTITLAVWSLCVTRRARLRVFGVLALICLVLAWGNRTPIYRWLVEHVSAFGLMRFPIKYVILPVFVIPLLAGFALARLEMFSANNNPSARKKVLAGIWIATVCATLAIAIIAKIVPRSYDDLAATWQNALARAVFFTAIVGGLFFLPMMSQIKSRRLLQLAILILVWLDLLTHMPQPQTVTRELYTPGLPRSWQMPATGEARVMNTQEGRATLSRSMILDPAGDYLSRRFALFSNCNLLDDAPKPDGFFPLQLGIYNPVFDILFSTSNAPPEPLMAFLGVRQITSPTNVFDWVARTNYLPMITGGQQPRFLSGPEMLRELAGTNFNPREVVYLFADARPSAQNTNAAEMTISGETFSNHRIECDVEASGPGWIVIAQTFYPNWRVTVDGQETPLRRANYAFQAVEVPAGRHHVVVRYVDKRFFVGAMISVGTLGLCVVVLVLMRRRTTNERIPS